MSKECGVYESRVVGDKLMMPADLKRLHKYMLDISRVGIIFDEMCAVIEELWPELAHKLLPKETATLTAAIIAGCKAS